MTDEVREPLGTGDNIIYRGPAFTYGSDAVLLTRFCRVSARDRVADIGAGTGFIAMTLAAATGAAVTGIELDPEAAALFSRAVNENGLPVAVENIDCRAAADKLGRGAFTAAVCNPPYFAGGTLPRDAARAAATHEGAGGAEVMCAAAGQLLKNGGRLYICYPAAGLVTVLAAMREAGIEPKRLALVKMKTSAPPKLALIEGVKGAKPGITVEETEYERG